MQHSAGDWLFLTRLMCTLSQTSRVLTCHQLFCPTERMRLSGNIMSTWAPGWKLFKNQLPQDTVSISIFSLYALIDFAKFNIICSNFFVLWKPFLRAHFSIFSLSFWRSRKNKIDASYAELLEQSWHQETPNLDQKESQNLKMWAGLKCF